MLKSYIHTRTQSLKAGIHIGSMIYSTGMMILPRQQPHVTHSTHTVLVLYTSRISGLLYTSRISGLLYTSRLPGSRTTPFWLQTAAAHDHAMAQTAPCRLHLPTTNVSFAFMQTHLLVPFGSGGLRFIATEHRLRGGAHVARGIRGEQHRSSCVPADGEPHWRPASNASTHLVAAEPQRDIGIGTVGACAHKYKYRLARFPEPVRPAAWLAENKRPTRATRSTGAACIRV